MARAGSLAEDRVVKKLNGYFVPVLVDTDVWFEDDAYPWAPRAARIAEDPAGWAPVARILEMEKAFGVDLSIGTRNGRPVHLTVLAPDGDRIVGYLNIGGLLKADRVVEMLDRVIAEFQVPEGEPVVPRIPVCDRRTAREDRVLQSVSRWLIGPEEMPAHQAAIDDVQAPPPGWAAPPKQQLKDALAAPSTDVFTLSRADQEALATAGPIAPDLAARLLVHLAPPTESFRLGPATAELTARAVPAPAGLRRLSLKGRIEMRHPWWDLHRDDERAVAEAAGWLEFDEATGRLARLDLVTTRGRYLGGRLRPRLDMPFAAAVRTAPEEP